MQMFQIHLAAGLSFISLLYSSINELAYNFIFFLSKRSKFIKVAMNVAQNVLCVFILQTIIHLRQNDSLSCGSGLFLSESRNIVGLQVTRRVCV